MELPELEPPPHIDNYNDWALGVMQGLGYSEAMVQMYAEQLGNMQDQVEDQIDLPEAPEEEEADPECPDCGEDEWFNSPSMEEPVCENCGHVGVNE